MRLIVSTNGVTALEQIILWTKEEFEQFLASEESSIFSEKLETLETLKKELDLTPYPQPYEYVKALQLTFDYSKITFSDEYFDILGIP